RDVGTEGVSLFGTRTVNVAPYLGEVGRLASYPRTDDILTPRNVVLGATVLAAAPSIVGGVRGAYVSGGGGVAGALEVIRGFSPISVAGGVYTAPAVSESNILNIRSKAFTDASGITRRVYAGRSSLQGTPSLDYQIGRAHV